MSEIGDESKRALLERAREWYEVSDSISDDELWSYLQDTGWLAFARLSLEFNNLKKDIEALLRSEVADD